ncbi:type II CRISPR RNA-guided endonuclease Cas9 [Facklamia sp. P12934]|uniref:type II CRISPR RNA-guided endonuclease Cas9 n=1 Tax=Facklamia sp. P12934 TaxID=3421948 RepID=UPI003D1815C5
MKKPYTIGLDIGTGSVGWAVLTEDLQLVRKNMNILGNTDRKKIKKNFWGVRLFDTGQTAEDTRMKRTSRRRLRRRRNRIVYLRDLFFEAIKEVDENFFERLDNSFFTDEDKPYNIYPIFGNMDEEKQYHLNFETIYHLRKHLADSSEKADLRLVYLALAHIIKYRGHFLIEGDLDLKNTSIKQQWLQFIKTFNQVFPEDKIIVTDEESSQIELIFKEKIARSAKNQRVRNLLKIKTSHPLEKFLNLIVGNKGNFQKAFDLEEKAELQLTKETYNEDLEELLGKIGDEHLELFTTAKATYDAIELAGVLKPSGVKTNALLSDNMISQYNEHKEDLRKLKDLVANHSKSLYYNLFRDKTKKGYAGYIDGEASLEEFYKYLRAEIKNIKGSDYFIHKMETEDLLRKQRSYHNGSIPHQVHQEELVAILNHQEKYYPFLAKNRNKILQIFKFRIPYYVGPLAKTNEDRFSWMTRKSNEAVRPWNFENVVNLEASATSFIEKMTNYDLYLPEEKVLPKRSLLYQKFAIFNELTKVSYKDERQRLQFFSKKEKEAIFNQLFKKNHSVSEKNLKKCLINELAIEASEINGIDGRFNASYSTYLDFMKIEGMQALLDDDSLSQMLEKIIFILTIFEDRKMKKTQLQQFNQYLTPEMIKHLSRKNYSGWGRLSAKLIDGIRDKQSHKTIMDYLKDDDGVDRHHNRNFMQLINDETLSFKETIERAQNIEQDQALEDMVYELPGSPAIKKSILQSLKIVEEVVGIMGYAPHSVVVEMAREHQTTAFGKKQSKKREDKLTTALKDFGSNLLKEQPIVNETLQNDRLYLYYLQNGKDMYTGEPLDIHRLSFYDIDHIIPRSFTTDNSIDNKVLVSSAKNRGKLDDVPSKAIVDKQRSFWERLQKSGLMSERKLANLTKAERGGLSEKEKERFLKRSLVETRQITKYVANILDTILNDSSAEKTVDIVTIKSTLASRFRKDFNLYKVREINDYHHAHDAYLNAVVANKILKVNPRVKRDLVYGQFSYQSSSIKNKSSYRKMKYDQMIDFFVEDFVIDEKTGEVLWDKNKEMQTIKKVLSSKQMNIVKKVEEQSGELYKQTLNPKGTSEKLIPIKEGLDINKYGGYLNPKTAFTLAIKDKKKWQFIGVTMQEKAKFKQSPKEFLSDKGFREDAEYLVLKKYTLYETKEGARRLISSHQEAQKGNQFVLSAHLVPMVYHAQHYDESKYPESVEYVNNHLEKFDLIFQEVIRFADQYIQKPKVTKRLETIYQKKSQDINGLAKSIVSLFTFVSYGAPAAFNFLDENITQSSVRYTLGSLKESILIFYSITGLYETRIKLEEL